MKRLSGIFLLVTLFVSPLFSFPLLQTEIGALGMGSVGAALSVSSALYANPALLFIKEEDGSFFTLSGSYSDQVKPSNFSSALANPLLENPFSNLSVSFRGSNVALTIQNQVSLNDRSEGSGSTSYRGLTHTLFQLDWATGRAPFSFGLNVRALAVSERNPVEIRSSHVVADYFVMTSLSKYETVESKASITVGIGLLLDYDWFKMGITSDSFAFANGSDPLAISADRIYNTLDWGFSFSTPTYDRNNFLHLLKLQAAMDLVNIGSVDDREIRLGFDLKLQLLPTWSVSIKSGYRETKEQPGDYLKFNFSNGIHTLGLAFRFDAFTVDLASSIPTQWYLGTADDDSSVEVMVALSFTL
ncbi:hypothetical protein [Sphaerochaeta sp. PS]|uniref:hypothetical protein n=1 Tax=Sphaerochaeta sp. PS TaxID=3076336 RepID=UPI0028A3A2DF|nr:hypothetical protein [Sphaerochaeta sp. PS]MDT4763114.1 hypothetical protein [Sphaerochaeta sp. PS]